MGFRPCRSAAVCSRLVWPGQVWGMTPGVDTSEAPYISIHAITEQLIPSTLKVVGTIHGQKVMVLIDSGLTNNFIQSRLATHLGLTVQQSQHHRVTVGNGDFLNYFGASLQIPLMLDETLFLVDLMLLPIYDVDVVLRVQWMDRLGPFLFDYQHPWMDFDQKRQRI